MLNNHNLDPIIQRAFQEDMNHGDITTDTLIPQGNVSEGFFLAKENGILAGISVVKRVFYLLNPDINIEFTKKDGEELKKGEIFGKIKGSTRDLLKGERTALNLLQHLSGIATLTKKFVEIIKGTKTRIADTRKTTVGLRVLEKYAVRVGGGKNHRFNLSDAVMIKDNHIKAVGGITKAITQARNEIPHTMTIEVEVASLDQLQEALNANPDIIMLDNMNIEEMKQAIETTNGQVILEASGNVSLDSVRQIAETGVNVISIGILTHSVKALDISMKLK
ncbi:MAG: carboxylating nicotinate-nucleotide diphosphorylase [Promethearchaeota archaeon]